MEKKTETITIEKHLQLIEAKNDAIKRYQSEINELITDHDNNLKALQKKTKTANTKATKQIEELQAIIERRPQTLAAAILQVMNEVKSVEKNLNVGVGKSSYKGVSDKDVKQVIQPAMVRAGLVIIPVNIEPTLKIDRWTEDTNYGPKQKQQIFSEVKVTFELIHESGESRQIVGYGHGIDSQDKSAGKATTYALKYALLYTFLIPTGQIDDADTEHSNNKDVPKQKQTLTDEQFNKALDAIENGTYTKGELVANFQLTEDQTNKIVK